MKLIDLQKIAAAAYDVDGTLDLCFHAEDGQPRSRDARLEAGDTLAEFIACEIAETFDPEADDATQLNEAHNRMDSARRQLDAVLTALENTEPLCP